MKHTKCNCNEWFSISTAPSGEWIMLYAHDCVFQACWNSNGYWSSYDNSRVFTYEGMLWQPLPTPPKAKQSEES